MAICCLFFLLLLLQSSLPYNLLQVWLQLNESNYAMQDNSEPLPLCSFCDRTSEDPINICNECKIVFYCGKRFQRKDWKIHKWICPVLQDKSKQERLRIIGWEAKPRAYPWGSMLLLVVENLQDKPYQFITDFALGNIRQIKTGVISQYNFALSQSMDKHPNKPFGCNVSLVEWGPERERLSRQGVLIDCIEFDAKFYAWFRKFWVPYQYVHLHAIL